MSQNQAMSSQYFRRQSKLWLIGAGVIAAAWLLVWLTSTAPTIIKKPAQADEVVQAALPKRIDHLRDLEKEVKPIDFSTLIRDMRTYPAEFRDKIFFENVANKYTVQLMDVAENQVIVDYLDSQENRDKYAYFRYLDANKKPHYILTFGQFASMDEANAALKTQDFGLPSSLAPKAVKAGDYLTIIDNYMRADSISDMASTQPRRINLQATRSEIPVQAATRADQDLARRSIEQAQARAQEAQANERRRQERELARAQLNNEAGAVQGEISRSYAPSNELRAAETPTPPVLTPPQAESAPKPELKPEAKPEPKAETPAPAPTAQPDANADTQ